MNRIIPCKQCDKKFLEIGSTPCHITISQMSHCDHCYNNKTRTYDLYFCSPQCLVTYMENKDRFLKNAEGFKTNTSWPTKFVEKLDEFRQTPVMVAENAEEK